MANWVTCMALKLGIAVEPAARSGCSACVLDSARHSDERLMMTLERLDCVLRSSAPAVPETTRVGEERLRRLAGIGACRI